MRPWSRPRVRKKSVARVARAVSVRLARLPAGLGGQAGFDGLVHAALHTLSWSSASGASTRVASQRRCSRLRAARCR